MGRAEEADAAKRAWGELTILGRIGGVELHEGMINICDMI
jgi:hypothetical protein